MLSHSQKFIAVNPLLRVIVEVINGIPKSLSNNKQTLIAPLSPDYEIVYPSCQSSDFDVINEWNVKNG